LHLHCRSTPGIQDNPGQRWLHPHEALNLGLAAPIRKLISQR
ncbi:MAG: A/G-specific adenine glycosylase, partial [Halomonadaceae bacterium]